jgi:hypothetical protein
MPGDPKQCREHAKRCLQLAQEATNSALRSSLEEIAQQWMRLATDLEATKPLLEAWGDPGLFASVIAGDAESSRRLSENSEVKPLKPSWRNGRNEESPS